MSSHHKKPVLPADGISVEAVDDDGVVHLVATGKDFYPRRIEEISLTDFQPLGRGAFGTVIKAKLLNTNETVAMKRVNRRENLHELNTLRILEHCNIIDLKYFFRTRFEGKVYLHLVTDAMPCNLQALLSQRILSSFETLLYSYQLFRALAYMHNCMDSMHRDIKPENILVDPDTMALKLCDLGSVEPLYDRQCYVGNRLYRAPELLLGSLHYSFPVDVWSAGCVFAEMFLGAPIFSGANVDDQLNKIIEVLGTPTQEDFCYMAWRREKPMPKLSPRILDEVLPYGTPPSAINLLQGLLKYNPRERVNLLIACSHYYYDQLRHPDLTLPNGRDLPPLFNFSDHELSGYERLKDRLIPYHIRLYKQSNLFWRLL